MHADIDIAATEPAREPRTAEIRKADGTVVYRQEGVLFPREWSQQAVNVVASKYFHGDLAKGTDPAKGGREHSLRQLIDRVAGTIGGWGLADGYLGGVADADRYFLVLSSLLRNQRGAFNSPVWFNVGLSQAYGIEGGSQNWCWDHAAGEAVPCLDSYERPQTSACFIQGVRDDMRGIMDLAVSEAMLFKYGSGTGTDLSTLRSTKERINGGGRPSGPVSYLRIYDAVAGVIKSGGTTRRSAKMNTLKVWHPDILEFVECKAKEDRKARGLIASGAATTGLSGHADEAYSSVAFQNANLSVRATDEFLRLAESNVGERVRQTYPLKAVTTGDVVERVDPLYVLDRIAACAWECGDPGMQYEDTIQRWHTCPNTAPINSSNPCSEYMHIDDSACNLSSINLLKHLRDDGTFDAEGFRADVRTFIVAQDILVDRASYPTKTIAENAHRFRQLGLGYANLGGLLMAMGIPYDSDEGRRWAAAITALMQAEALRESATLAEKLGAYDGFIENREPHLSVARMHLKAADDIALGCDGPVKVVAALAAEVMTEAIRLAEQHGFRNAQVSVLAPTGTIAFMMDCDTTGIEPAIALVAYKELAGGGMLKIANNLVPRALARLGYTTDQISFICNYIEAHDAIEGAPHLRPEHLPVFDCALPAGPGRRSIHWRGHLKMMAAVQPFLSGAISKTINMPADATVEDVREAYLEGWKLGLKAVAIYRDGSKGVQPLKTAKDEPASVPEPARPRRERLPETRQSVTHHFEIDGHDGYVTVGLYENGRPGEVFVKMAKEGSTMAGMTDCWATMASIGLQAGVPLETICDKFAFVRFEPSGFTKNRDVPIASSIVDYIARWLRSRFLATPQADAPPAAVEPAPRAAEKRQSDAPPCPNCGSITIRAGVCYACRNCGISLGCG